MILSADTTLIQSTILTLLSYSKSNECDSGGDEIQSNNKSKELSLILQKPRNHGQIEPTSLATILLIVSW